RLRGAGPHSVIAVAIRPEAVTTIAPVGVFLHRSPFLDEDMPDNVEVSLFTLHFVDATRGQFRAKRVAQSGLGRGRQGLTAGRRGQRISPVRSKRRRVVVVSRN